MSKIVRKWRPDDYWRIGEHESWFQDMALKGLHLKKTFKRTAKFEVGEPRETRYRIDIHNSEYTNIDKEQIFKESGWEYVTEYDDFNVYTSPTKLNAPELHTDPIEQAHTLKTIEDKMAGLLSIFIIGPITFLIMLYLMIFKDSTFSYGLLNDSAMLALIIIFIGLRGIYDTGRSFLAIRVLRKNLLEVKLIDHNASWKNRNWTSKIVSYTLLALILIVYTLSIIANMKRQVVTLDDININLPIVRLADVEKNQNFTLDEKASRRWYYYKWKIIAPIHYETYERGGINGEYWDEDSPRYEWEEKGEVYTPSIMTETYQLITPKMSLGVFNGLIKEVIDKDNKFEHIKIENPNFEMLEVYKSERFLHVFAYKGKGVIRVRYSGKVDLNNIIKAIEDKIKLIEN